MQGQRIGSMIAAVFGLLFVLLNTGALPPAAAWTLRAVAAAAFGAVLIAVVRVGAPGRVAVGAAPAAGRVPFGRAYWVVVAAEVVALFAGVRVLTGLGHPDGGVAWVSFVVGVHFFALAQVFQAPFFNWLGATVTACGVVGLILVFAGAAQSSIDVIAGIVPGALLLAFGWWGATGTHKQQLPTR